MTATKFPHSATELKIVLPAALLIAAAFASAPALAQTDQQATVDDTTIEEITVTGIRGSLDNAALIKRSADQMIDTITAEDIGLFSDSNIAEALGRVPGVQLERDAGEGFRISIRGLGPRFIRTTVNGRTALSSAGGEDGSSEDSRGFTLNMMPSEVITRVTVEKSTLAKNLEGGMGGTLDMQTNRPLDFARRRKEDFYVSTAIRAGYNDLVESDSLRASLFLNKKFSDNFGFFTGIVLDDTDRADHAIETEAFRIRDNFTIVGSGSHHLDPRVGACDDPTGSGVCINGVPQTQQMLDDLDASMQNVGPNGEDAGIGMDNAARNSSREYDRARQTFTTGLQWQSGNFDVNFDWTYGHEDNDQFLRRFAMSPSSTARRDEEHITSLTIDYGDQDFSRTTPTIGTITAYEFAGARGDERVGGENRWIPRTQDIHVGGLNVDWSNDVWSVNGDIGYALQETERFDNQVGTQWNADDDDRDLRFELMNGSFTTLGPGGYPVAYFDGVCDDDACGVGTVTPFDPTDLGQQFFRRAWRTLTTEEADDVSARLDFGRIIESRNGGDLISLLDEVLFGISWNERNGTRMKGRFREDDSGIRGDDYADIDVDDVVGVYQGLLIEGYLPDVPGAVHDYIFVNHDDPVFDAIWAVPASELLDRFLQKEAGFDVTEEVTAAYVQLPFSGEGNLPYRGNIGLRYVHTEQTGFAFAEVLDEWEPRTTERTYDDYLPSFNLALDVSDTVVLRFSANKSLSRPDPLDMTSYLSLGDFEDGEDDIGSGRGGNPDLEPYRAVNYDATFEWYPESGGSYAFGLFHKDLDGWIAQGRNEEVYTVPVVDADGNVIEIRDELYSIRRKVNTDGGTIQGAELAFHLPFDSFSDGFLGYFGVNGSVTYVDAEMDAVVPENNLPISLRGTSEWSGNLVAYFEKEKFSARAAANYRDDFLFQEAEDEDRHAEWTEGATIIDVNMSYRFQKSMSLRFSANNLTGETRQRYWQQAATNRFSDDRDNGQYYTLEFRYHTR